MAADGAPLSQVLGLVYLQWDGYNEAEQANRRRMRRCDFVGVPATALGYFLAARLLAAALPPARAAPCAGPPAAAAAAWAAAAAAVFVVWQHMRALPYPVEDTPEMFRVQGVVGRWVFLTRQALALQAVHAVASLPPLAGAAGADAARMALPMSALGLFVTVQFFALVWPAPDIAASKRFWGSRGVPMGTLLVTTHVPAAFLALSDLFVVKERRALLQDGPDLVATLVAVLCFTVYYVVVLHTVHAVCGEWPYSVLRPLGKDVGKWVVFIAVQAGVLGVFVAGTWFTLLSAPVMWSC